MSGIKHIVANVDGSRHDAGILRLSAALANRFGAILEAVFANVPPFIPVSTDGFIAPQMIEALESQLRERAAAGKTALAKLQLTHGKPIWTERAGSVADVVISQGRYADLTLLAQHAPEENDVPTEYDSPAEVVMALGRPVLMVPYAGTFSEVGKRVLVAWTDRREAARAFADALPLLADGHEVLALSVNPEGDATSIERNLERWMAEHGVRGKARTVHTTEIEVADVILSASSDFSADLVVMGAYGRSLVRELVLGGVTHSMFRHMTTPVLMSH